jgi:predicted MPP superfamily phosphohydrolase
VGASPSWARDPVYSRVFPGPKAGPGTTQTLEPTLTWRAFLTFLAIVLLIMGSVHWYLFERLVVATALPSPWDTVLGFVLAGFVVSIPLSFIASRQLDKTLARYFVVPVYVWLGFAFQAFFLVLAIDLFRLVAGGFMSLLEIAPLWGEGAEALRAWRVTAGVAVGSVTLATAFAIVWGLTRLVVRRIEIPLRRLPPELDGFTILHLTDLHLDLVHGRKWLEEVVARANALDADLIAITGDLAEGSVAQFGRDAEPIGELTAPHGVFFVTGNHEYFHDLPGWLAYLEAAGVKVLRNERVAIGNPEIGLDLAGVDDPAGSRLAPGHGPDLARALEGRDPEREVVLLAHQPLIIREAARHGVGLVLSGHTHGGQIWPFSYLVYLQQPYVKGLKEEGGTRLYLSSGTGFWGPPMRLGTTAEMALITLRSSG